MVLLALSEVDDEQLLRGFCGRVLRARDLAQGLPNLSNKTVYLCGDLGDANTLDLAAAAQVWIIRERSRNYAERPWPLVGLGRVPLLVHGVGIQVRRFFDLSLDYFKLIGHEHAFQSLTESNKPGRAHRTGIYLTPVERHADEKHFRLLRCSTNLSGPTENFRATDRHIVDALNQEAARLFDNAAPLNHVLAQVYHNTPATENAKQTKAKIQAHADKTKDMPVHGIMAFCTFYDQLEKLRPLSGDPFDYGSNDISGLTKLHFRLKTSKPDSDLPAQFTVTLYPGSVFFMPLSSNRLYTHEIRSSMLNAEQLPTRLGYVVRCSSTQAVHVGGHTYLEAGDKRIKLEPATPEATAELRALYAEENKTEAVIDYESRFPFSMNQGDYLAPRYTLADEFRSYALEGQTNPYSELLSSARFEAVAKGRQGTVLVLPDRARGIPIVRTTTTYAAPAQCFHPAHARLAKRIEARASLARPFNNALIEHYTSEYSKMGFHSDQAQDLDPESFIAIYSCYQSPELSTPPRKLVIETKEAGGGRVEIPLVHDSVVVFALDTNRRCRHTIALAPSPGNGRQQSPENPWLGVTFRTSKTFVRIHEREACFEDGSPLTLATPDEAREFFSLRRRENTETQFFYPRLTYTLSDSDRMLPAVANPDRLG